MVRPLIQSIDSRSPSGSLIRKIESRNSEILTIPLYRNKEDVRSSGSKVVSCFRKINKRFTEEYHTFTECYFSLHSFFSLILLNSTYTYSFNTKNNKRDKTLPFYIRTLDWREVG